MRLLLVILVACLAVPLAADGSSGASPLSPNLVKNPGAEAGPATPDTAQEVLDVPSWHTTGGFFAAAYSGFRWAPDPKDRTKKSGAKFFVGCFAAPGESVNAGTATQTVSLARWAKTIDKGGAQLTLSAELGGYDGTENLARASAAFLSADGRRIGRPIGLKGPTYIQRQGVTRVEPRSTTKPVPPTARSLQVALAGSRAGSGPCGFIDNVSAVLVSVPK